ncbi:MAG: hypothetical protein WKF84_19125 [Pyrinomonadaceae bacterium]
MSENALTVERRAGVVPGDSLYGRLIQPFVLRDVRAVDVACGESTVVFNIHLLNPAEAAKLALDWGRNSRDDSCRWWRNACRRHLSVTVTFSTQCTGKGRRVIHGSPWARSCK